MSPRPTVHAFSAGSTSAASWRKRDDGGCQVEAHPGAKIVRDGLSLGDGTVEAQ